MAIGFGQLGLLTVTFAEHDQLTGGFHFESVGSYSCGTEPQTENLESNLCIKSCCGQLYAPHLTISGSKVEGGDLATFGGDALLVSP